MRCETQQRSGSRLPGEALQDRNGCNQRWHGEIGHPGLVQSGPVGSAKNGSDRDDQIAWKSKRSYIFLQFWEKM